MVFSSNYSDNILKTDGNAESGNFIPEFLRDAVERDSIERSLYPVMTQAGAMEVDNSLVGSAGNSFTRPTLDNMTASDLTEGSATSFVAVSTGNYSVTVGGAGLAVQQTWENRQDVIRSLNSEIPMAMSDSITKAIDEDIVSTASTTTNIILPDGVSTVGGVASSNTFDVELLMEAEKELRDVQEEPAIGVLSTKAWLDLVKTDNLNDASKFGGSEVIKRGQIGNVYGIPVVRSTYVQSADEGETSTTVYKNLLMGRNSMLFAWKIKPIFEAEKDSLAQRSYTLHSYARFGTTNKKDDRIVVMKAA